MSQKHSDPNEESNLRRKLREYEDRQRARQAPVRSTPPAQPPAPPAQATQPAQATRLTPARSKPRQAVRPLGLYIPWWGFLIVVGLVGVATCALWTFVFTTRDDIAGEGIFTGLTPTFLIITHTPPQGELAQLVPPTEEPPVVDVTATVELLPDAPPPDAAATPSDDIVIGNEITIFGTEGDGLAIRQGPGLSYSSTERADGTYMIALDGEVFLIEDGPRENDDYIWWYITDPNDADRFGWAVQDFMLKVPGTEPGPLQEVTPEPTQAG